jgi:hypothetical protein
LIKKTKTAGLVFAAAFVVIGLVMMAVMAWRPAGLGVPLWVAEIGVSAFIFAGLSFAARAFERTRLSVFCSIGVVIALAVPGMFFLLGAG